MKKFFFWIWLLVCLPSVFLGLSFENKLRFGSQGDYIVVRHKNTYTLLHLHTQNVHSEGGEEEIIFEEISIAAHKVQPKSMDWKKWVRQKAPGHTSWILYSIDLQSSKVTECFSHSRQLHIKPEALDHIFTKLLHLHLSPIPESEQIQRSAVQKAGQVHKTLWAPRQYIEGSQVLSPTYDVVQATWPNDGSELAKKKLLFYFDKNRPLFPFPYWIQARYGAVKFTMHAVDSGSRLVSPCRTLPRRPPAFFSQFRRQNGELTFTLKVPYYYKNVALYAVDTTVSPRKTVVFPITTCRKKEIVTVTTTEKALAAKLTANHRYLWIVGVENSSYYAEFPHLFTYLPLKAQDQVGRID